MFYNHYVSKLQLTHVSKITLLAAADGIYIAQNKIKALNTFFLQNSVLHTCVLICILTH
jgi:hypothetical protein